MIPLLIRAGYQFVAMPKTRKMLAGGFSSDYGYDQPSNMVTSDGICLLPVCGPIMKGCGGYGACDPQIVGASARMAIENPSVKACVVVFDTPGGTVAGTDDMHRDLKALASAKPCMGYVSDECCSAGMWGASAMPKIMANETAIVGSIGVRMELMDCSKMYENAGVKIESITTGAMKDAGADYKPLTDDVKAYFQKWADDLASIFYSRVSEGRRLSVKAIKGMEAAYFIAGEAKEKGLIDSIGSIDDAIGKARSMAKSQESSGRKGSRASMAMAMELAEFELNN